MKSCSMTRTMMNLYFNQIKKSFKKIENRINNSIFDAEKKKQVLRITEDL